MDFSGGSARGTSDGSSALAVPFSRTASGIFIRCLRQRHSYP